MIKYHLYLFDSEGDRDCILASIKRNPGYFDLSSKSFSFGEDFTIDDALFPEDEEIGPMIVYFWPTLDNKARELYTNIADAAIIETLSNGIKPKYWIFVRSHTLGVLRSPFDSIDDTIP